MKKFLLSALMTMAFGLGAFAMSYDRAQAEALYLTDKMAYELNLNDQQYNDAYEINLDYFLSIDTSDDLYRDYNSYRLADMRCILHDWQYDLMLAADYFLRPIVWRAGGWFFPIYTHYNVGLFYYSRPAVYGVYTGFHHSHYHHSAGFYAHRRPVWNGGLRGPGMHHSGVVAHRGVGPRPGGGRVISGRGYHFETPSRGHRPDNSGYNGHSSRPGNSGYNGNASRPGNSGYSGHTSSEGHRPSSSGFSGHTSRPGNSGNSGFSGHSSRPGNSGFSGNGGSRGGFGGRSGMGGSRGNSFDGSSSRMGGDASRGAHGGRR